MALLMHSISWGFMVLLPLAWSMNFNVNGTFLAVYCVNVAIHFIVDDLKANKHKINLIVDQTIHLIQIAISALILL